MATNNYVRQESKSIFDLLNQSEILPSSHAILLLDEIHRYRTIDEKKKIITRNRYGDLWKLLSDGSLIDSMCLEEVEIEAEAEADYRQNRAEAQI